MINNDTNKKNLNDPYKKHLDMIQFLNVNHEI